MPGYSAIAANIATYVYRIRQNSPTVPQSQILEHYNHWAHQAGFTIQDPQTAVWAYRQMATLFAIPFGLMHTVARFDHLPVG